MIISELQTWIASLYLFYLLTQPDDLFLVNSKIEALIVLKSGMIKKCNVKNDDERSGLAFDSKSQIVWTKGLLLFS